MQKMNLFSEGVPIYVSDYIRNSYSKDELIKIYKELSLEDPSEDSTRFTRSVIESLNKKIDNGEITFVSYSTRKARLNLTTFHTIIFPLLIDIFISEYESKNN